ncbi:MAG: hypothetical protein ABSE42_00510 [Bryobacteraceae bacterium]|jgi:hypothetical protein
MIAIRITRCDLLRAERNELFQALADEHAYMRERLYLRGLIHRRLQEISEAMASAGCPKGPDEGQYADLEREWEEELAQLRGDESTDVD